MADDDRTVDPNEQHGTEGGKKPGTTSKGQKRRKVNHACLYCRRSHMTCDEGRPCQRCIKRDIGHLCHDERKQPRPPNRTPTEVIINGPNASGRISHANRYPVCTFITSIDPPMAIIRYPAIWPTRTDSTLGSEFSVLSDFLQSLDNRGFQSFVPGSMMQDSPQARENMDLDPEQLTQSQQSPGTALYEPDQMASPSTAQSPELGTNDSHVIHAKYEAGLLRPYNYVKGYARLSRWMDHNMSNESKKQIIQPLSVLRPKFRAFSNSGDCAITNTLSIRAITSDYDRVFSAMGIPACLWRRTGEIYKGNREFAELVGVDPAKSAINSGENVHIRIDVRRVGSQYWEKYGHVAFDPAQKAVLTSCVLRYKPTPNTVSTSSASNGSAQVRLCFARNAIPNPPVGEQSSPVWHRRGQGQDGESNGAMTQSGFINCCFSFTIRRDTWGIPSVIVGNFIMH
ncbi:Fungal Zn(2)-Cys(6) binuclear cluster domain [Ceratobasidium sp. AG-Ba]|nr:Fungal Zn(2)-Cys(6) binuclear cluster domain [Ceratobasidium sp. AG-Ba]